MELDPFSHEFHHDPYPVYRWLRDNAPCYRNEKVGFYALSRYQDVLDASQQPLLYSSAEGTTIEMIDTKALLPMMIFMDPPEHDVQRKLVSRAFTPRAISELEPFVRATAVECLEPLVAKGQREEAPQGEIDAAHLGPEPVRPPRSTPGRGRPRTFRPRASR